MDLQSIESTSWQKDSIQFPLHVTSYQVQEVTEFIWIQCNVHAKGRKKGQAQEYSKVTVASTFFSLCPLMRDFYWFSSHLVPIECRKKTKGNPFLQMYLQRSQWNRSVWLICKWTACSSIQLLDLYFALVLTAQVKAVTKKREREKARTVRLLDLPYGVAWRGNTRRKNENCIWKHSL